MTWRRMWLQQKQLLVIGIALVVIFLVLYSRLQTEVSRLDESRLQLAKTVARLQLRELNFNHNSPSQLASNDRTSVDNDPGLWDAEENIVMIYNRVPKTGSTSFVGVAYDLCSKNQFHVLHINVTKNSHVLSLSDQARFVYNVTKWNAKKPSLYHGHMAYLDFERFGVSQKPVYVNIIRKPLDRLVSYYYFLRNGDNFRPYVVRRKQGDKMTFDECVEKNEKGCEAESMWLQIPFFCGHAVDCWIPGNDWALAEAKRNLLQHYLLVGVTEELEDFVTLLELTLPRMFKGASKQFLDGKKSHLRKTYHKVEPSEETVAKIQAYKIWQMENDFYEFVVENFHAVKRRTLVVKDGEVSDKGQQFMFEKIRPKTPTKRTENSQASLNLT